MNTIVQNWPYIFFCPVHRCCHPWLCSYKARKGSSQFLQPVTEFIQMLPRRNDEDLSYHGSCTALLPVSSHPFDLGHRPIQGCEEASTRGFAMKNIVMIALAHVFKYGVTSSNDTFTLYNSEGQAWLSEPVYLVSIAGQSTFPCRRRLGRQLGNHVGDGPPWSLGCHNS
ncbi:hypothetical protein BKA93DRAFT_419890 [Sparassis latifolia]